MKQLQKLLLPLILSLACTAMADTNRLNISGEEYVLTEEDSPLVVQDVSINDGGILRLEAGAELIVVGDETREGILIEGGQLIAEGTANKPVRITHLHPSFEGSKIFPNQYGSTAISLEHTIWDMGPNALIILEQSDEAILEPVIVVKNSILRSRALAGEHPNSVIAVYAQQSRLIFEDTLFASSTTDIIRVREGEPTIELRRCVFSSGSVIRPLSAIRIENSPANLWQMTPDILIEDCRFSGYSAAISVGNYLSGEDSTLQIAIRGSDFSNTTRLLEADDTLHPFDLSVEWSHVTPTHIGTPNQPNGSFEFVHSYMDGTDPFTNSPDNTFVADRLDESPFRHADINGDGRTDFADLRELMKALAGEISSAPIHDIDNDGDITIRDLALLRAYVDGTLLFLPEAP